MTSSSSADDMRALIPLHINGALRGEARERFEARLRVDVALRREREEFLEIEEGLREREARAAPDLDMCLRVTLARVTQSTSRATSFSSPRRGSERTAAVGDLIRRFFGAPRLAWAVVAAQLAVIVVLVAYQPAGRDVAQTLSEPPARVAVGPRLHVVFAERATQADVRTLLAAIGARIADGPTEVGMLTLELEGPHADAAKALARLRASGIVVFAERAY